MRKVVRYFLSTRGTEKTKDINNRIEKYDKQTTLFGV